jgi:hypothetical protein
MHENFHFKIFGFVQGMAFAQGNEVVFSSLINGTY